uniref:tRNA/rRNA methyltransferase SpoU type domain-containing protein n=1 Tax=Phaeodactylum tricornutum TaxID=2850 RepID=A0A8J9S434_PHATR
MVLRSSSGSVTVQVSSFLLGAASAWALSWLVQQTRKRPITDTRPEGSNRSVPCTQTLTTIKDDSNNSYGDKDSDALREPLSTSPAEPLMDSPELDLRLIRKAEAVIQWRTSSITIVVERCTNDHNYSAILRTAEALGIQNVWIIDPPQLMDGTGVGSVDDNNREEGSNDGNSESRKLPTSAHPGRPLLKVLSEQEMEQRAQHRLFAQNATEWITLREFTDTASCLHELRATGHQIWATDLSQQAVPLEKDDLQEAGHWPLPNQLAIVFGTEAVGCSQEMLRHADLRVYLPLRGFADSLNLSVATALVIQALFVLDPDLVGRMHPEDRTVLRQAWFSKLARQRLLSSAEKKKRKKLVGNIAYGERLQLKVDAGDRLERKQIEKLAKLEAMRAELIALDEASLFSENAAVDAAVAEWVRNPPAPLTDVRRADTHRVTFVGKGTKKLHAAHWKDMVATNNTHSVYDSSSSFFRARIQQAAGKTKTSVSGTEQ